MQQSTAGSIIFEQSMLLNYIKKTIDAGVSKPRPDPVGFSILPRRQHFNQGCLPGITAGLWSSGNVSEDYCRFFLAKSSGSPTKSQIFVGETLWCFISVIN